MVVDSADMLDIAISELSSEKVLGFDTETRPSFTKGKKNKVALLQLSGSRKAYLFRLSSIGIPEPLTELLEKKNITKVGAAIKEDLNALKKIAPFEPSGFIDLQSYVEQYGIEEKSVRKMAAIVLGIRISKAQQLSNWENNDYSEAQKLYAATDAWVCREIYEALAKHKPILKHHK